MAHEPRAPDLGAIRERCERALQSFGLDSPMVMSAEMLSTLLDHIDAQAARLAAVEAAGRQWRAAVARTRPYDGELVPWKSAGWQDVVDAVAAAEAALEAALAALDAPPGESP